MIQEKLLMFATKLVELLIKRVAPILQILNVVVIVQCRKTQNKNKLTKNKI